MLARSFKASVSLLLAGAVLGGQALSVRGQDPAPPAAAPSPLPLSPAGERGRGEGAGAPVSELPAVPKGVEVLTRGPVHEAFASLTTEAAPTTPVAKQPPKPIEEMPPQEKPEGA